MNQWLVRPAVGYKISGQVNGWFGYVRSTSYRGSYVLIGIEPFLDFLDTDWGGPSGLTQNRTFAGLGIPLGSGLTAEVGYMNQYFWLESRENLMNNLGVIQIKSMF